MVYYDQTLGANNKSPMESFFRKGVLRRAWSTLWSHKTLWFFGLFAAILSLGEEYDLLVRNSEILDAVPRRLEQFKTIAEQGIAGDVWRNFVTALQTNVAGTLGVLVTWLVAILAVAWLVIVAQAALVEGARREEERKPYNILEGFDTGMANFWQMFLLNVIAKIVVYGLLFIVIIPLAFIFAKTGSVNVALIAVFWSFIVLIPVITIVAFVMKFASAYIVIKKYPVRPAIVAGWNLFLQHWLVSIELAFILIIVNFVVIYAVVSSLLNLFGFPNFSTFEYLLFLVILGFIFSWLTTFQFAAWTHLFFRLEEGHAPSKLRRIIHYVLGIEEKPSKPAVARAKR